jgi:CDP-diacylglycerol--serine O-phosphatidyltransferase
MVWLATHYQIQGLLGLVAGITVTAVAGLLMTSRFAYLSFKDVSAGRRVRFANLLAIPLVIIVIAIHPQITIFVLFLIYASSGPLAWLWHRRRAKRPEVSTP